MKSDKEPEADDDAETRDCAGDHEDDIDWDDIMATAGGHDRVMLYVFHPADFATQEEAMEAMSAWIDSIFNEVLRRAVSESALHTKH